MNGFFLNIVRSMKVSELNRKGMLSERSLRLQKGLKEWMQIVSDRVVLREQRIRRVLKKWRVLTTERKIVSRDDSVIESAMGGHYRKTYLIRWKINHFSATRLKNEELSANLYHLVRRVDSAFLRWRLKTFLSFCDRELRPSTADIE